MERLWGRQSRTAACAPCCLSANCAGVKERDLFKLRFLPCSRWDAWLTALAPSRGRLGPQRHRRARLCRGWECPETPCQSGSFLARPMPFSHLLGTAHAKIIEPRRRDGVGTQARDPMYNAFEFGRVRTGGSGAAADRAVDSGTKRPESPPRRSNWGSDRTGYRPAVFCVALSTRLPSCVQDLVAKDGTVRPPGPIDPSQELASSPREPH